MKSFREEIRGRMIWMGIACAALAALVGGGFFIGLAVQGDSHIGGFITGVQTGLFAAVLAVLVRQLFGYRKALADDKALRTLEIQHSDERTRYIRDRIGGVGLNVVLFMLAAATVVSGFFDHTVFFTLLAALGATALVKALLKGYFIRNS